MHGRMTREPPCRADRDAAEGGYTVSVPVQAHNHANPAFAVRHEFATGPPQRRHIVYHRLATCLVASCSGIGPTGLRAMSEARIETLQDELDVLRSESERESLIVPRRDDDELLQRVLGDRIVLESLPEIVCVLDRDFNMLYLNRSVPGRYLPELIGTSVLELIPAATHPRYRDTFDQAWMSGEVQSLEFTSISGYSWQSRFVPVREEGDIVLMLVTSSDVTERVATERALRESESRLRHAMDVAGMGTWSHDWCTNTLLWDAALCVIYGIRPHEVPRGYEQFLARVHPEDRHRVHQAFVRSRATGMYEDLEHRILRPTGEVRHVLAKGSTTYDKNGEPNGSLGAAFDVTARKRLEEQLYQGQKMEAIGQLTAGIAHNFNNVLSIILPNVGLCRRDASPPMAARLADVEHAAERAADLVRQLMLFARRDVEATKSPIDPLDIVRRTLEICRTTFDRGIRIELMTGLDVPRVIANAGQLEQVMLNICINARDALESSNTVGPQIRIAVDRSSHGDVLIRVSDNGVGMEEATRSRVFEPFFTTKEVGRGTGLGLASAYAIVTDHRGCIRCDSHAGEGTTFEIELPAMLHRELTPPIEERVAEPPRGTETVVIVDDEPLVRRATRALLEQGGYRVLECSDGEEALRTVERERDAIDLVILDRSMPGLSGEEVFEKLQGLARDVPIVLMSGQPGAASTASRAAAVLNKPVELATLLTTLRSILDGRSVPA
jgi:PAS domain S-box-containing protein